MGTGDRLGDLAGAVTVFGLGCLMMAIAATLARRVLLDLWIRLRGSHTEAVVVEVVAERHEGENLVKYWPVVTFTTDDGRELNEVRLRNWTSTPPRIGSRTQVYYLPHRPRDAERSPLLPTAGRLLVGLPLLVATGVFFLGYPVGVWDRLLHG